MNANRAIIVTTALVGALAGAAIGAWTAEAVQARHFNHPAWARLGPACIGLFGALFGLAALELGRWIASIRRGRVGVPIGWQWPICVIKGLARMATALIGVRLGFEAGLRTAVIWPNEDSSIPFTNVQIDFVDIWIGAAFVWGGVLAFLGLRLSRSLPAITAFLGAYLGLHAVRYVAPAVADLYRGPYHSGDHVMYVSSMAALLTISLLIPTCAVIGYWSGLQVQDQFGATQR